jgi:hypothetical protein
MHVHVIIVFSFSLQHFLLFTLSLFSSFLSLCLSFSVLLFFNFSVFLDALAKAKNTLWTRHCLSVCRVFNHIVTTLTLDHIVTTITLNHIVATMTLDTTSICYSLGYPAEVIARDVA